MGNASSKPPPPIIPYPYLYARPDQQYYSGDDAFSEDEDNFDADDNRRQQPNWIPQWQWGRTMARSGRPQIRLRRPTYGFDRRYEQDHMSARPIPRRSRSVDELRPRERPSYAKARADSDDALASYPAARAAKHAVMKDGIADGNEAWLDACTHDRTCKCRYGDARVAFRGLVNGERLEGVLRKGDFFGDEKLRKERERKKRAKREAKEREEERDKRMERIEELLNTKPDSSKTKSKENVSAASDSSSDDSFNEKRPCRRKKKGDDLDDGFGIHRPGFPLHPPGPYQPGAAAMYPNGRYSGMHPNYDHMRAQRMPGVDRPGFRGGRAGALGRGARMDPRLSADALEAEALMGDMDIDDMVEDPRLLSRGNFGRQRPKQGFGTGLDDIEARRRAALGRMHGGKVAQGRRAALAQGLHHAFHDGSMNGSQLSHVFGSDVLSNGSEMFAAPAGHSGLEHGGKHGIGRVGGRKPGLRPRRRQMRDLGDEDGESDFGWMYVAAKASIMYDRQYENPANRIEDQAPRRSRDISDKDSSIAESSKSPTKDRKKTQKDTGKEKKEDKNKSPPSSPPPLKRPVKAASKLTTPSLSPVAPISPMPRVSSLLKGYPPGPFSNTPKHNIPPIDPRHYIDPRSMQARYQEHHRPNTQYPQYSQYQQHPQHMQHSQQTRPLGDIDMVATNPDDPLHPPPIDPYLMSGGLTGLPTRDPRTQQHGPRNTNFFPSDYPRAPIPEQSHIYTTQQLQPSPFPSPDLDPPSIRPSLSRRPSAAVSVNPDISAANVRPAFSRRASAIDAWPREGVGKGWTNSPRRGGANICGFQMFRGHGNQGGRRKKRDREKVEETDDNVSKGSRLEEERSEKGSVGGNRPLPGWFGGLRGGEKGKGKGSVRDV